MPEQQVAFRRGVANDLLDANPDMCKPPSVTVAALSPQVDGVVAHQMSIVDLPNDLIPTIAAAGAEGVYGASTLTPWEAAIVREAKAVGQSAKGLAMPVLVLGLLALGALQAVETGNTSTIQRAWAMVR